MNAVSPDAVPAAPPHPYATRIPDRAPQFKTHRGLGQAKNAIINKLYGRVAHQRMTIYKLSGSEYVPWVSIEAGQTRDDIPELAPKPKPKTHVQWEIRSLAEQEQRLLRQAAEVASRRRELEQQL